MHGVRLDFLRFFVTSYTSYDKNGNALEIKVKDAAQRELRTVYAYDALNRLRTTTRYGASLPDNITRYSYDANGNRASVKDPESNETKYLYNYQRKVTKVTDARLKDWETSRRLPILIT